MTDFLSLHPECLKPAEALGNCWLVSHDYVARHPGARMVSVEGFKGDPSPACWRIHPAYWIHTLVEEQGVFLDWTARQFDPTHPVPRRLSREELEREWRYVSTQ